MASQLNPIERKIYLFLAAFAFCVSGATAKYSIEIPQGEAEWHCHHVFRTPSLLENEAKAVGKVCGKVSDDERMVNIDVFMHSNEDEHCYFNNVHFSNLPLTNENGLMSESYSFQISTDDLGKFICASVENEDVTTVDGEGLHTCVTRDVYAQENSRDHFQLPIRCIDEGAEGDERSTEVEEIEGGYYDVKDEATFEDANGVDAPLTEHIAIIEAITSRNYLVHTPKTGGTSVEHRLRGLFDEVLGEDEGKRRVCRVKNKLFDSSGVTWDTEAKETGCVIATGEQRYHPSIPDRSYAILRNPQDHVLSQYFHCTESPPGRYKNQHILDRGEDLPSLDEWLNTWIAVKEKKITPDDAKKGDFKCYDPTNLQAYYLSNGEAFYPKSKQELWERYESIGLTTQTVKSSCIIFIKLTGIVPSSCNCSSSIAQDESRWLRHGTRHLRSKSRRLDQIRIDHGVTHHGDTFHPTEEQMSKIEILTEVDRPLYEYAMSLFEEQVDDMERQYGITLCGE